jgi:hypothetical protein
MSLEYLSLKLQKREGCQKLIKMRRVHHKIVLINRIKCKPDYVSMYNTSTLLCPRPIYNLIDFFVQNLVTVLHLLR